MYLTVSPQSPEDVAPHQSSNEANKVSISLLSLPLNPLSLKSATGHGTAPTVLEALHPLASDHSPKIVSTFENHIPSMLLGVTSPGMLYGVIFAGTK